jgi:hypothetical protein
MRSVFRSALPFLGGALLWLTAGCKDDTSTTPEPDPGPDPNAIASIQIDGDTSGMQIGQTRQLSVIARNAAGAVVPSGTVQWQSSNPAKATVDGTGVVTALAADSFTISATAGTHSDEHKLAGRFTSGLSPTGTTVHVNPEDPVLVTRPLPDGRMAQFAGLRDGAGTPTRLTTLRLFGASDAGTGDVVHYGEDGLPTSFASDSTGQVFFQYLAGGTVRVILVAPDGSTVEGGIQLTGSPSLARAGRSAQSSRLRRPRAPGTPGPAAPRSQLDAFRPLPDAAPARVVASGSPKGAAESRTVRLRVNLRASAGGASLPVTGARVDHVVRTTAPEASSSTHAAAEVSPGVYDVTLKFNPAPSLTLQGLRDLCSAGEDVLSAPCDALEKSGFTAELTAFCTAVLALPIAHAKIMAGLCRAAIIAAVTVCGPAVQLSCAAIVAAYDHFFAGQAGLNIATRVGGLDFYQTRTTQAPGPVPAEVTIDILLPLLIRIGVDPADPAPGQSYVATTYIRPAGPGFDVEMSIVGTDGYEDSDSGTTGPEGTFSLFVPGAEGGVLDVLTSRVGDQVRTTSIVF